MGLYRKKNNTEISQIAGNVDYSEINELKQNKAEQSEVDDLTEKIAKLKKVVVVGNPSQSDYIPYPEGFNVNNCIIGSIMGYYPQLNRWFNGFDNYGTYSAFFQLGLNNSGAYVEKRYAGSGFTSFKFVFERID